MNRIDIKINTASHKDVTSEFLVNEQLFLNFFTKSDDSFFAICLHKFFK